MEKNTNKLERCRIGKLLENISKDAHENCNSANNHSVKFGLGMAKNIDEQTSSDSFWSAELGEHDRACKQCKDATEINNKDL